MLTMLKFVGVEEGRARPSSRDSRVEGECCACLFLVMRVGVVQGLNWELSGFCRRENEKLEKTDWPAVGGAYRETVGGTCRDRR